MLDTAFLIQACPNPNRGHVRLMLASILTSPSNSLRSFAWFQSARIIVSVIYQLPAVPAPLERPLLSNTTDSHSETITSDMEVITAPDQTVQGPLDSPQFANQLSYPRAIGQANLQIDDMRRSKTRRAFSTAPLLETIDEKALLVLESACPRQAEVTNPSGDAQRVSVVLLDCTCTFVILLVYVGFSLKCMGYASQAFA